jgi:predicted ATPase
MATPGAEIFEVSEASVEKVELEDAEHYFLTKSFLNDPEVYLRHL